METSGKRLKYANGLEKKEPTCHLLGYTRTPSVNHQGEDPQHNPRNH